MKFGAHMSTGGGVWKALERGRGINCEVVQLFVKNNMQWFGKPHAPADLTQYANELNQCGFACVFGHTGYLIDPDDSRALAGYLQTLAEDRGLLERLSLNARERYLRQPSWAETAENIRTFLYSFIH